MTPREVSFATWSAISADVGGKGREALLDRLETEGIEPDAYELAAVKHLTAIAQGLAAGDASLASEHADRCARARSASSGDDDPDALEATQDPASDSARDRTLPFAKTDDRRTRPPAALPLPDRSGETAALSTSFVASPSTPFEQTQLDAWTIDRYAAFVADRRHQPRDFIEARYGLLTEREEVALLVHFNRRFRDEPGLRDRWQQLVTARERSVAERER